MNPDLFAKLCESMRFFTKKPAACACGRSTCTESWEPGCGLGEDEEFCRRASPEEEAAINDALKN